MKYLAVLFLPLVLWAQSSSEHFALAKSVLDAGGSVQSSANFELTSVVGQPTPPGRLSSASFVLYAGFLSPRFAISPLSPIQRLVILEATPNINLYWESVEGASGYSVFRDTTIDFVPSTGNLIGSTTGTAFVDTNVLAGPEFRQYYIVAPH